MRYRLHKGTCLTLFSRLRAGLAGVPKHNGLAIFVDKGRVYMGDYHECPLCGAKCWSRVCQESRINPPALNVLPIVKGEMREWCGTPYMDRCYDCEKNT